MTKESYIRAQIIQQNRLMAKYRQPVYSALRSQIDDVIEIIHSHGLEYALHHVNTHFTINTQIGVVVNSLYAEAAGIVYRNPRKVKSIGGFIEAILNYFSEYIMQIVIIPISRTTNKFMADIIQKAIDKNEAIDKVIKDLEDDKTLKFRSKIISRTEATRVFNYAALEEAKQGEFRMRKEWVSQRDNRVRRYDENHGLADHTHNGVDREKIDLEQRFSNGLMYPGDPEGIIQQTINCRCYMNFFYKLDFNGNRIPKNILQNEAIA